MRKKISLQGFFNSDFDRLVSNENKYSQRVDKTVMCIVDAIKSDYPMSYEDEVMVGYDKGFQTFSKLTNNLVVYMKEDFSELNCQFFELILDYVEGNVLYRGTNDYLIEIKQDPDNTLQVVYLTFGFFQPEEKSQLDALKFFAKEGLLLSMVKKTVEYCEEKPIERRSYSDPMHCLSDLYTLYKEESSKKTEITEDGGAVSGNRAYGDLLKLPVEWQLRMFDELESEDSDNGRWNQ